MEPEYIENGNQMIVDMCRDKVVVDVGCIYSLELLCGQYKKRYAAAKECYGFDNNAKGIGIAKSNGVEGLWLIDVCDPPIQVGNNDVELFMAFARGFTKTVDLVIATDIIEHLMNVGNFLDNMKYLMGEKSKLFIGTANLFHLTYWMRKVKGTLEVSLEHTCWYDEVTLRQVVEFAGYKVEKMFYYGKPVDEESMYLLDMQGVKTEPWMSKRIGVLCCL